MVTGQRTGRSTTATAGRGKSTVRERAAGRQTVSRAGGSPARSTGRTGGSPARSTGRTGGSPARSTGRTAGTGGSASGRPPRRRKRRFLWRRFIVFILILLLLVFGLRFAFSSNFRLQVSSALYGVTVGLFQDSPELQTAGEPIEEKSIKYRKLEITQSAIGRGDLLLINGEHEYSFDANLDAVNLISLNESGTDDYSVYGTQEVDQPMFDAFNMMMTDFVAVTGNNQVRVVSAYRTYEYQENLYNTRVEEQGAAEADLWVSKPSFSEHHNGLVMDIGIANGDGADAFTLEGDYAWVEENCYRYGIIRRYMEGKEAITGVNNEPWHYRYVGLPHAYIMNQNGLCFEEYIESLRFYNFYNEHLQVTVEDGTQYEIYYVQAEDGERLPVPTNYAYEISGNNVDGFIVTVNLSQPVA